MARSNTTASARGTMRDAQRMGREATAATSSWSTPLARFGYAAKGVVYIIIGVLAAKVALGDGGTPTDRNGALRAIYEQPFGKLLLAVVAIGLIGYALWMFIQAIADPERKGGDAKGIGARLGYGGIGVSYTFLALAAGKLVMGTGNGGKGSNATTQDLTARLLALPFGPILVTLVGLAVVGGGLFLLYRAYSATFQKHLDLTRLSARGRDAIVSLGRAGYAA